MRASHAERISGVFAAKTLAGTKAGVFASQLRGVSSTV